MSNAEDPAPEAPAGRNQGQVPVFVHEVAAIGSTKTRADYLDAEFALIRAATSVDQLGVRILEAQQVHLPPLAESPF